MRIHAQRGNRGEEVENRASTKPVQEAYDANDETKRYSCCRRCRADPYTDLLIHRKGDRHINNGDGYLNSAKAPSSPSGSVPCSRASLSQREARNNAPAACRVCHLAEGHGELVAVADAIPSQATLRCIHENCINMTSPGLIMPFHQQMSMKAYAKKTRPRHPVRPLPPDGAVAMDRRPGCKKCPNLVSQCDALTYPKLQPPHNTLAYRTASKASIRHAKRKRSLSIFVPTSLLTPHAVHPTQLRQAVECLRYILHNKTDADTDADEDTTPSGSALCVSLAASCRISPIHMRRFSCGDWGMDLGGAVMMSPWTTLLGEWERVKGVQWRGDYITAPVAGMLRGRVLTGM
ncbi:hypothetical protein ACO22_07425 [Paracoccidioides brasiliensis]|uniref:Uncharacterized protein n=1 Tax=Paracoccidioides brasiliensis TaxID=121759 RepID=A0A1D2J4P7_PARBR|nr:hypothetical protein ACO22_07425 [Paracoccidioides brasiliensis]